MLEMTFQLSRQFKSSTALLCRAAVFSTNPFVLHVFLQFSALNSGVVYYEGVTDMLRISLLNIKQASSLTI